MSQPVLPARPAPAIPASVRPHPAARPARLPAPVFAWLLACALVVAGPAALRAQEGLAPGTEAPAVVLETLDGEEVDLGEVLGKRPVLLEFWATWCAVCRALEPTMAAAHEAYGEDVEFVVVAAAVAQTRDRVRAHLQRHPMPGRLLWDARGRFTRAYDAPGTGYVVIVAADGRVAYAGTGPGQDLEAALARVLDR